MSGVRYNPNTPKRRLVQRAIGLSRFELRTPSDPSVRFVAPAGAVSPPIKRLDPAIAALVEAARQRPR